MGYLLTDIDQISEVLAEIVSQPFKVVLVPAPEPHFDGHMVRAVSCRGALCLELIRKRETVRVRTDRIVNMLKKMKAGKKVKDCRYKRLIREILSGEIYEEYYK